MSTSAISTDLTPPIPAPATPIPAAPVRGGPAPDTIETVRPLPKGAIGLAWPTYRPVYPYTRGEIADGVDVYTRALKAAARSAAQRQHRQGVRR